MKHCTSNPKLKKQRKTTLGKVLILQETEAPKKLLIFYKKKAAIMFQETETPKTELSYISG